MKIKGKVHKYGSNINTDAIIPARYLNISDPGELAKHVLEGLDGKFASNVQKGDIIVAGDNFGCGSSREHAAIAIKAAGVAALIAKTFARIFYRNAINIGLPVIECSEAVAALKTGDIVSLDLKQGILTVNGENYKAKPYPEFVLKIIEAGGLMNLTKESIDKNPKHEI